MMTPLTKRLYVTIAIPTKFKISNHPSGALLYPYATTTYDDMLEQMPYQKFFRFSSRLGVDIADKYCIIGA
jgi:hypothetical protein